MSLLFLQHDSDETPARFGEMLRDLGHRLNVIQLYNGEPFPPDLDDIDGIISLGGPMNPDAGAEHPWMAEERSWLKAAHEQGLPVVGICLGAELLAEALGGEVAPMDQPEVGWHPVNLAFPGQMDPLFAGIPWQSHQFHLHGWEVSGLPPDATPFAGSAACRTQAFRVGLRSFGFQYHFEWTESDIRRASRDPFVAEQGVEPETLDKETSRYYADYRRLGDRLCERLGILVFGRPAAACV